MKTQNQVRITNENVRITAENVQHIGECIALSAIKKMMRFAHHPRSLDKLYAGLVEDIYGNRGYNTTFSDGYDLASEVICFLCHYIGHNLDDLACQNRKGELLTVRLATDTPCGTSKKSIFPAIRPSASKNARWRMLLLISRLKTRLKTTPRSIRSSIKCV